MSDDQTQIEKAKPSHKPSLFLTALGAVFMDGDVQPLYSCPHPTSNARLPDILLRISDSSMYDPTAQNRL